MRRLGVLVGKLTSRTKRVLINGRIGLDILIGFVIADRISEGHMVRVIAVYGCAVVAISALATLGPVRGAFRIQPIDALRAEG